jgi:ethanolaminephosphotransferase
MMAALKTFSLGSTSFIEEEHQTVYFFTATAVIVMAASIGRKMAKGNVNTLKSTKRGFVISCALTLFVLGGFRVAKKLNQTGDKYAHIPDMSDWLLLPENVAALSGVHGISLAVAWWLARISGRGRLVWDALQAFSYLMVYLSHSLKDGLVKGLVLSAPNSR